LAHAGRRRPDEQPGGQAGRGILHVMTGTPRLNPEFAVEADILQTMLEVRRAIHAAPELSHEEHATSARLQVELRAAGLGPPVRAATTGLVVDVAGTRERATTRTIAM